MKIVFFGPTLTRAHGDRRSRVLFTLLEGVVGQGHHVVYVEPESDAHGGQAGLGVPVGRRRSRPGLHRDRIGGLKVFGGVRTSAAVTL